MSLELASLTRVSSLTVVGCHWLVDTYVQVLRVFIDGSKCTNYPGPGITLLEWWFADM